MAALRRSGRAALADLAVRAALVVLAVTCPAHPSAADGPQSTPGAGAYVALEVPAPGGGTAFLQTLGDSLGPAGVHAMLALNRVDARHAAALDTLILYEGPADDVPAPFPALVPMLETTDRVLLVSRRVQAYGAYERGRLVRWGPVCTGAAATPTPAGWFHVNWKNRTHRSTVDSTWRMPWTVNIDNREGTALHAYDLPGRPASHCCIRLAEHDARWIFDWVETWTLDAREWEVLRPGTPVLVFGDYDYGAPPPWRRLPVDPGAASVTLAELEAAIARWGGGTWMSPAALRR